MQDFNYDFTNAMELTIEVSCCKYPERNRLLGGLQCPQVFFSWLLDHIIHIKLREKALLFKTEQIYKMRTQNGPG